MSCFLGSSTHSKSRENEGSSMVAAYEQQNPQWNDRGQITSWESVAISKESPINIEAKSYTFRELAAATNSFKQEFLIGEGGFGRVYKGKLEKTGQVVAVKQLDKNRLQGNREFLLEISALSTLNHPNLVDLIGYCLDGDQRLLVYEFMPLGSLEDHLLVKPDAQPIFRKPNRFPELADPLLRGEFPEKSLNQAIAVAAMCLHEEPIVRPLISDVVTALSFMSTETDSSSGFTGSVLKFQPSSAKIKTVEDLLQY
uniref:Protein kinase domain-containing protein n=1 Tax=Brassica oleracea var. oleracea TaxID=109376 RepID=A0A0D3BZ23_BRAOL